MKLEITNKVRVGANDGDRMPLEQCVCGDVSKPWEFVLGTDPDDANKCDVCGREMWFEVSIRVFQKLREEDRLRNQPLVPYGGEISEELIGVI